MSLDAKIKDALVHQRHRQIVLSRCPEGWQASLLRPDDRSYRVRADADPLVALYAVLDGFGATVAPIEDDLIG